MSIGFDREPNVVSLNDTAQVRAFLFDKEDNPIGGDDAFAVSFTIQRPDKTQVTIQGTVEDDGTGTTNYNETDLIGQYLVVATFTLDEGVKRSSRADFEVIDPFKDDTPSQTYVVAAAAWAKVEDCFDAEDEGPWLRDMTLNFFNKDKMESFIDEALLDVNLQHPHTALTVGNFVFQDAQGQNYSNADFPLLVQAVFICVVRHLMRSYTEQPNPVGVQVGWHDRRDYLQRWQSVYQIEYQQYLRQLALYKRQFLGIGSSALLLGSKAGRLIPAPMRTRFAGRGYW